MRIVILVAVVAAHMVVFLLFPSWRRPAAQSREEGILVEPIYLPPLAPVAPREAVGGSEWQAPLLYRSGVPGRTVDRFARGWPAQGLHAQERRQEERLGREPSAPGLLVHAPSRRDSSASGRSPDSEQSEAAPLAASGNTLTPTSKPTDWHAQANLLAEEEAKGIVAAEDAAERRAKALTAPFKPLAPPHVPAPEFGWDYAPTHRFVVLPRGGFAYSINDNCQILVLPMPFIGCLIGKQSPNGDLFKNMHRPVKYGDWDWRIKDP